MTEHSSRPLAAFVRQVSPRLGECELTHVGRAVPDVSRALQQHEAYANALGELGARVHWLPPLPENADGVFVEDTAIVVPEIGVIARPGALSRQPEVESTAAALSTVRSLRRIEAPGCIDGGDVLRIDRTVYVGASTRTNAAGIEQLRSVLEPLGYRVRPVPVEKCLHLKTGVTFIPPDIVLLNPLWIDPSPFADFSVLAIDKQEPFAANTLTLNGTTLVSADYPRTAERLAAREVKIRPLAIGELHKAEAGLTCLSIVLDL